MNRYLLVLIVLSFLKPADLFAQIDYNDTIQPIFTNRCVTCHGGTSGVTLSSYNTAMNSVGSQYGTNIIIPGEPEDSPLVDKISSANPRFGIRMPGDGTTLSEEQIAAIRLWIEEGAHESVETSGDILTDVPDKIQLFGNYPNPFNPSTVIQFNIPEPSEYLLTVYSATGKKLQEKSGIVQAGQSEFTVNMSREPSGIYFYRIRFLSGHHNQPGTNRTDDAYQIESRGNSCATHT